MNPLIVMDTLAELRAKMDSLEAAVKADVVAVVEPVAEAVEADAPVLPVVAQDIEAIHAKVDGVAAALIAAIQRVDSKVDGALDVADGWALHPKVLAAAVAGAVATAAAYVAQLNGVHVAGGTTTGSAVAALLAVAAGWVKSS